MLAFQSLFLDIIVPLCNISDIITSKALLFCIGVLSLVASFILFLKCWH